MLINRDNATDDSFFENLVIQEDNNTNQKAVLIKYTPTSITNSIDNSFIFEGTIQKSRAIHFSGLNRTNLENITDSDCYVEYTMCNWGGNEHHAGAECTQTYVKRYKVSCVDDGSGNGMGGDDGFWSGDNGDGNFNGGGSSGGGGGNSDGNGNTEGDNNNYDGPSEQDTTIITSPITNGNEPTQDKKDPCNQLKKILQNNDFISGMDILKNNLNGNFEKGFTIRDTNGTISTSQVVTGNADGVAYPYNDTTPQELENTFRTIGTAHNHIYDNGHVGIFTPEDITNSLYLNALIETSPQNPYSKPTPTSSVNFVVTNIGFFALKITDFSKLQAFALMYGSWSQTKKDAFVKEKFKNQDKYNISKNSTHDEQVIGFLLFLKDYDIGISLYEADSSDFSNLRELQLTAIPPYTYPFDYSYNSRICN
jgi:hypothetical protein